MPQKSKSTISPKNINYHERLPKFCDESSSINPLTINTPNGRKSFEILLTQNRHLNESNYKTTHVLLVKKIQV
jgi:hypothetical protein